MGSTSRIITDYVFTLVTFHFVRMSFGLSLSFSPPQLSAVVACDRAAQGDSEREHHNLFGGLLPNGLPLPFWVLDRDGGQKAGQQQSRGNGQGIERTAPMRPNAL